MKVTAKIIKSKEKWPVKVATFYIENSNDKTDKNVIAMDKLLRENPTYKKVYFQQQGPCSNWGYDVFRDETDAEYESRIKKENKAKKRLAKKFLDQKPDLSNIREQCKAFDRKTILMPD